MTSQHRANITYVDIGGRRHGRRATYFELSDINGPDALVRDLDASSIVRVVEREPPFGEIYGKRSLSLAGPRW